MRRLPSCRGLWPPNNNRRSVVTSRLPEAFLACSVKCHLLSEGEVPAGTETVRAEGWEAEIALIQRIPLTGVPSRFVPIRFAPNNRRARSRHTTARDLRKCCSNRCRGRLCRTWKLPGVVRSKSVLPLMIAATFRRFRPRTSSLRPGALRGETGAFCRAGARETGAEAPSRPCRTQLVMPANLATHTSPSGSVAAPAACRRWPYLRASVEVFQFELQD